MTRFREHVWYNLRDLPLMIWRDASVQHFDTLSGDYIWPPRTNSCVPFRDVYLDDHNKLHSWHPALQVAAATPTHTSPTYCCTCMLASTSLAVSQMQL